MVAAVVLIFRRTFRLALLSARLALGVVPRPVAFLPVFPLRFRPSSRRLASRFVTGARTGIRPCFVTVPLWVRPEPSPCANSPLTKAVATIPWWLAVQTLQFRARKHFPTAIACRYRSLNDDNAFALSSNKPVCFLREHSAYRLSDSAWTAATVSSQPKLLRFSVPCGSSISAFCVPKTT